MGVVRTFPPVQLICAVCHKEESVSKDAVDLLQQLYGPYSHKSDILLFDHTKYYQKEMGTPLYKYLVAFERPIDPMDIVEIKLTANSIENQLSVDGNRRVNLDPGYLEAAKFILATTKNFSHRIYLGRGIFGDVQLYWREGAFQANPWTYPDYLEGSTLAFLTQLRQKYVERGSHPWH